MMKEDKLEKFVRDHKDSFDDLDPGIDVWNKIEQNNSRTININWKTVMWRAAAVLLIFSSSFVANEYWHQYRNAGDIMVSDSAHAQELEIPELLEAEAYYSAQFEDRLQEVRTYSVSNPEIEKDLKVEMEELDAAFQELKTDLKDDIDNQEIVEAMIQNYRIKVRMLEEIISRIKEQQNKPIEDEKVEYEL